MPPSRPGTRVLTVTSVFPSVESPADAMTLLGLLHVQIVFPPATSQTTTSPETVAAFCCPPAFPIVRVMARREPSGGKAGVLAHFPFPPKTAAPRPAPGPFPAGLFGGGGAFAQGPAR